MITLPIEAFSQGAVMALVPPMEHLHAARQALEEGQGEEEGRRLLNGRGSPPEETISISPSSGAVGRPTTQKRRGASEEGGAAEPMEGGPTEPVVKGTEGGQGVSPRVGIAPQTVEVYPEGTGKARRKLWDWWRRGGGATKIETTVAPTHVKNREYEADEHRLTLQQLAERYQTHIDTEDPTKSQGLTSAEATRRLKENGPNILTPPKELPEILKFLKQYTNGLLMLLIAAVGLALLAWGLDIGNSDNIILAGALAVIVLLTGALNYYHERAAHNVLASIQSMLPAATVVIRDGKAMTVNARDLVNGDIVHLTIGKRVPADIRIIASADYKVEMSSLTGESDAIECGPEMRSQMPLEARNIVFCSSLTMSGDMRGVVIRTGDKTFIGSIAGLVGQTGATRSSLELEISRLIRFVVVLAVTVAVVFFAIGLARGRGFVFAIVNGLLLTLVANVPEGLPTTVVSMLTLGAQMLAARHIFIKKTDTIETLGAATVIASDKTGTLTMNVMTVENIWCNRSYSAAGRVKYTPPSAVDAGIGRTMTTIGKQTSMLDHVAAMTIGRQFSRLRDGTMVIHSTLRRPGGTIAGGPGARGPRVAPSLAAVFAGLQEQQSPQANTSTGAENEGETSPEARLPSPYLRRVPSAPAGVLLDTEMESEVPPDMRGQHRAATPPSDFPVLPVPGEVHMTNKLPATELEGRQVTLIQQTITKTEVQARPMQEEKPIDAAKSHPPSPNIADVLREQGSFRSFYSFQGFTRASWMLSNSFTRLMTIAAICNRANFAAESDEEGEEGQGEGEEQTQASKQQTVKSSGAAYTGPPQSRFKTALVGPPDRVYLPKYQTDSRKVLGDASESALLRYADSVLPIFEFRLAYPLLHEVPFNSINKWALAITRLPEDNTRHLIMMKGAPERIVDRCSHFLWNGKERPIDDDFRIDQTAAYERFGCLGERVLGFAYKVFPGRDPDDYKTKEDTYPTEGLVFCGLISLVDPPKEGVDEAITLCRRAFVKVIMVTGDHPLTAEAIARKVGIVTKKTAREIADEDGVEESNIELEDPRAEAAVVPGYALPAFTQAQWDILLKKEEIVFARTSPQQKLQIVEGLQRLGHVVAVTGDGTNDAPALKKAQIGVSMGGPAASDVAREAADVILLDDNFASIVTAIEMGRLTFDNLKKSTAYTLSHAMPELVPIFLDLAFGIPLALPGLLILTIDLITEQGPAISLAYEPAESNIMDRRPRDLKTEKLIDGRLVRYSYLIIGVLETLTCLMAYFTVLQYYGISGSVVWNSSMTFFQAGAPDLVAGGTVFTAAQQLQILYRAHAAYYFNLIACQCINVFLCKTRYVSIFQHGIMRNHTTAYGVFVALFVAMFFIYVDGIQNLFKTFYLPGYWFLTPFAFALFAVPYTEYSKWKTRQNPDGWWAKHMQW
jgi:magnesium-transporting ATPase (P-type)